MLVSVAPRVSANSGTDEDHNVSFGSPGCKVADEYSVDNTATPPLVYMQSLIVLSAINNIGTLLHLRMICKNITQ